MLTFENIEVLQHTYGMLLKRITIDVKYVYYVDRYWMVV